MDYNDEFTLQTLKTDIKKTAFLSIFILSSRKFIISSFVSSLFLYYLAVLLKISLDI